MTIKLPIYLDYQSTTPMDPRVIDVMVDVMKNDFGNPHSRTHIYGWRAEEMVEIARKNIADLIGADPNQTIWRLKAWQDSIKKRKIILSL
jgi:cysteine desulfurase